MEHHNKYGFTPTDFDTEEPPTGHHQRFMERLEGKKKAKRRFPYGSVLSVAATILVLLGIWMNIPTGNDKATVHLSAQNRETQQYFSNIICKELDELKKQSSPETKPLIDDALQQLKKLDSDYTKLMAELSEKGENSQIIHAMITNLQTRISFLEKVSEQIDNINKLKSNHHEYQNL
ncbi:MAG: anti-sigma factor [Flavobacterium sp. BFFFF1]|uniref:anti-sigma factor n=1 Tax=Flavobacterium sp. BFFFF1 TaxID=2015557 RepID=UPI000BDD31D4|nr:anti-sigma factor [Flavobacterium sp. BFFFF1]OYU80099.1 MAG: anti-sigma factor [Flavobacterium sp. BFFFF1]